MQCSSTSYLPGTWSRRSQLRCSSLPTVLLTRAARHSDRDLILFCPAVEDLDVVLSVVFVSVLGTRADTPYEAHRALLGQAMVGEPRAEGKKDCPGSIFMSFYAFRGGTWCTVSCSWRGASIASLATISSTCIPWPFSHARRERCRTGTERPHRRRGRAPGLSLTSLRCKALLRRRALQSPARHPVASGMSKFRPDRTATHTKTRAAGKGSQETSMK